MSTKNANLLRCLVLPVLLLFCACGNNDSGTTGSLRLGLTDAAMDDYQAIYVTIGAVQVVSVAAGEEDGAWQTVLRPAETHNLLELVNGIVADLGLGELAAGDYGQLRLILAESPETGVANIQGEAHPFANYLIDAAGDAVELKVPSGLQTGIKIVKGFTVVAGQTVEMILDFDAGKSVVRAGNSGKWLLKPTIKVLEGIDNAVAGSITDGTDPMADVLVSAQRQDPEATDSGRRLTVAGATLTDTAGRYRLLLDPGIYTVVAGKEGYQPSCRQVSVPAAMEYQADFILEAAAAVGTLSVQVSGLVTDDASAAVSIRQAVDCGAGPGQIEVASANIANGGSYSVVLPVDDYTAVVMVEDEPSQEFAVEVASDGETLWEAVF